MSWTDLHVPCSVVFRLWRGDGRASDTTAG